MKHSILLVLFYSIISNLAAQENAYIRPQFKNGERDLHAYLDKNLKYPINELHSYTLGKCFAKIYINKDGKVALVLVDGNNENMNMAVKNTLKSMPPWKPAKLNSQAIDTLVMKTIYFSIDFSHIKQDSSIYECILYRNAITDDEQEKKNAKANALWRNGLYEFENKDYEFAIDFFNKAEEFGMINKNLYYYRGIAHFNIKNHEKACKDWSEAVKQGDVDADELYKTRCQ